METESPIVWWLGQAAMAMLLGLSLLAMAWLAVMLVRLIAFTLRRPISSRESSESRDH